MKTETAIDYAKRVYPDVSEITQLQIANAYLSGATERMRLATEKFTRKDDTPEFLKDDFQPANVKHYTNHDKGSDIVDEEEVEDEEYNKASSNLGTLI